MAKERMPPIDLVDPETPQASWRDGRTSERRVRALYAVVSRLFAHEMLAAEEDAEKEMAAEHGETPDNATG